MEKRTQDHQPSKKQTKPNTYFHQYFIKELVFHTYKGDYISCYEKHITLSSFFYLYNVLMKTSAWT